MQSCSLSHVADALLLRDLHSLVGNERSNTALMLAHIAEVDERQLYRPAAYPSMFEYCVGELRLSEDATSKRIHAARAARKFLAIFPALASRVRLRGPVTRPSSNGSSLGARPA